MRITAASGFVHWHVMDIIILFNGHRDRLLKFKYNTPLFFEQSASRNATSHQDLPDN